MSVFPVITKEKQQMYEDFCWINNPVSIPCICGYCGRACRQMGAEADTASCTECGLSVFVSIVDAIKKCCDEKQQTGSGNLHDSDISDIQNELAGKAVKVEATYIKKILECLTKEDQGTSIATQIINDARTNRPEILFRAKRLDNGKWIEGYYYKMAETTYCFKEDYERHPVPEHHFIVFTRMTDWGLPNQVCVVEIDPNTLCRFTGFYTED